MEGDERIEIDLVSFDGVSPSIDDHRVDGNDDGARADQRRALIATGLGVGAVALALGWMIGSSTGSSSSDPGATTTPVSTMTSPMTSSMTDDTIAAPRPTTIPRSTTAPGSTSVPVVSAVTESQVDIAAELRGLPYEVAFSGGAGDLMTVNLQSGVARRFDLDELGQTDVANVRYLGGGRLLASTGYDNMRAVIIGPDATVTELDLPTNEPGTVALVGDHQAYLVRRQPDGTTRVRRLDDLRAPFVVLHGWVQGADPAGGLLVQADGNGGVFRWTGEGPAEQVTRGYVIAIGVDRVVAMECEGIESCGYVLIDRRSGERSRVTLDLSAYGNHPPNGFGPWQGSYPWAGPATIQGDLAFVTAMWNTEHSQSAGTARLELETGLLEPVVGLSDELLAGAELAVTDEWEWVFTFAEDDLSATNLTSGDRVAVFDSGSSPMPLSGWTSIDVRHLAEP